jgi:hypothetical protein
MGKKKKAKAKHDKEEAGLDTAESKKARNSRYEKELARLQVEIAHLQARASSSSSKAATPPARAA